MLKRYLSLFSLAVLLSVFFIEASAQCPSVGGQVTCGTTICPGNNAPILRLTGYDGTVISWQQSMNNGLTWGAIPNKSITYSPGVVTGETLYRAIVRKGFCPAANSLPARISISSVQTVGGTLGITVGNDTICSAADLPTMTLAGQVGTVIRWESSINNGSTWQNINNTTASYRPSDIPQTTLFRAVVQSGGCNTEFSTVQRIVVAGSTSSGEVTGSNTVCSGKNSFTLTLLNFTGTILRWERSPDGITWTNIVNVTPNHSDSNIVSETWYRAVVQSGVCPAFFSLPAVMAVARTSVAGTISVNVTTPENEICIGSAQADVILSLNGNVGTVVRWEYLDGTDDWIADETAVAPTGVIDVQSRTLNLSTYKGGSLLDIAQEGRAFRAIVRANPCDADTTDGVIITFEGECCQAPDPSTVVLSNVIIDPADDPRYTRVDMELTWAAPTSANVPTSYHLQYRALGSTAWKDGPEEPTDITLTVEGIQDGVCYEIRVHSLCEDTPESSPESVFNLPITTCICTPIEPRELETVILDSTSVELTWFHQSSNARYEVRYNMVTVPPTRNEISIITSKQKLILTGLSPATEYRFNVRKLCFDGENYVPFTPLADFLSSPVLFTTPGTYSPCDGLNFFWTKKEGGTLANDFGRSLATDAAGYVYALGEFQGTAQIGSYTLSATTSGKNDYYVAKYDNNGTVIWATRLGSGSARQTDGGRSIVVDEAGNVFVTGRFYGSTSFGNTVMTSAGLSDVFVARLRSSDGFVLWARRAGGTQDDAGYGVDFDDFGSLVISGSVTGTANFGNQTTVGGTGQTDAFVAKYAIDGTAQWVRRGGNPTKGTDVARSVITDEVGNIYATGSFFGDGQSQDANWGSIAKTNNTGFHNAFVVKYDPDGTPQYVQTFDNAYSEGSDIDVDDLGNLFVTGYFAGNVRLGIDNQRSANRTDVAAPSIDILYAKMRSEDGAPVWLRKAGGTGDDFGRSVAVDAFNNIFVAGYFDSPVVNFIAGPRPPASSQISNTGFETSDIFIAKVNSNGTFAGAKATGSADGDDAAYGLTVTADNLVYATGDFRNTVQFGNDELEAAASGWDAWISQMGCVSPYSCDIIPQNVFVSNVNDNEVSVSWDPIAIPNEALEYEIRYRPLNRQSWEPVFKVQGPPANIKGIFAGTPYEVQVRTVCNPDAGAAKSGNSLFSDPVRFETRPITNCPVPTGLVVDNLFLNAAEVAWNPVVGAARYVISYRRVIGDAVWTEFETSSTFFTINGLSPNVRYEVRVRSLCTQTLDSQFSLPVRFTTLTGSCVEPQGVTINQITPNSTNISWFQNNFAQSYQVQWRKIGSFTWSSTTTTNTNYTMLNLESATNYEVRVRTICGASNEASPYTPRNFFTTSPVCGVPSAISILDVTMNTADVTWTAVSGAISYEVEYKPSSQVNWIQLTASANNITLTALNPGTAYDLRVRTNCGNGNVTAFRESPPFTTERFCEAPSEFTAQRLTATEVVLQWVGPSNAVGYYVQYRLADGSWNAPTVITRNVYSVTNLMPDFSYEFRVYTICEDGSASDFASTTITTTGCETPSVITVVNITGTSARLSWNEVPGVIAYVITYYPDGSTDPNDYREISVSDASSAEMIGLLPGVKYVVTMTVDCGNGPSEPSSPVEFTTQLVCQSPRNLNVIIGSVTETAAPILWDPVNGARSYVVYWKKNDASTEYNEINVSSNSFVLTGLSPDTEYLVYVRTNCGGSNLSVPSTEVFFKTIETSVGCFSPTIGNVAPGRTTATVTWSFVASAINYTVSWRRLNQNPPSWINVNITDPTVTTFRLANLIPDTEYEVRVRTRCSAEVSDWSQEIFRTLSLRDEFASSEGLGWSVYPNPSNGQFQIDFTSEVEGSASVKLVDMSGRTVYSHSYKVGLGEQELSINADDLSAGVYFLFFEQNDIRQKQKLILN